MERRRPGGMDQGWIKGYGSKEFFCIDIQDVQNKVGFNRVKKGAFLALGNKSIYLFLSWSSC